VGWVGHAEGDEHERRSRARYSVRSVGRPRFRGFWKLWRGRVSSLLVCGKFSTRGSSKAPDHLLSYL